MAGPRLIQSASVAIVLCAGLFLLALGLTCLLKPRSAAEFLMAFASTPAKHILELAVRLVVGFAFVVAAPGMAVAVLFTVVGWVLVVTTSVLAVLPWRWHRQFAARVVPAATSHLGALGTASSVAAMAIVGAVTHGPG